MDLEGKRCVVTGASVGIGRALAIAYGSRGAAVDLIARSRGALEETAQLVQAAGGSATVHVTDLTDVAAVEELATGLSAFGEMFVIANVASAWHDAGRAFQGRLLFETPTAEILQVLDVGIRAPMVLTARLLPRMIERRSGHVTNISGTFSSGGASWLHYYVSKKALEEFTRGLAQELRPFEIQVNCISPADVATEPYNKFFPEYASSALQPGEIAEVALELLSPSCRHITGQVIEVRNRTDHAGEAARRRRERQRPVTRRTSG